MKQCDSSFQIKKGGKCAVIVAHPDDETLWAGGMILLNPQADWSIITLCRKSDAERSVKFFKALDRLHAVGYMGDMGDSPEQSPLNADEVQKTIEDLLPARTFELVITHNPLGEYTRHLRHEETASAVLNLCRCNKIQTKKLLTFAYTDNGGEHFPRAVENADLSIDLSDEIWQKKYNIITKTYGFDEESFEAKITPRKEAFNFL